VAQLLCAPTNVAWSMINGGRDRRRRLRTRDVEALGREANSGVLRWKLVQTFNDVVPDRSRPTQY
jgi:hypothetical protein